LLWWKEHESIYPKLAAMARDILCIPSASTEVERVFNTARDICGYRRCNLNPDTIRLLIMQQYHLVKDNVVDLAEELAPTMLLKDMTEEQLEMEYYRRRNNIEQVIGIQYISETEIQSNKRPSTRTTDRMRNKRRRLMREQANGEEGYKWTDQNQDLSVVQA
jgi:hypothetical protein